MNWNSKFTVRKKIFWGQVWTINKTFEIEGILKRGSSPFIYWIGKEISIKWESGSLFEQTNLKFGCWFGDTFEQFKIFRKMNDDLWKSSTQGLWSDSKSSWNENWWGSRECCMKFLTFDRHEVSFLWETFLKKNHMFDWTRNIL